MDHEAIYKLYPNVITIDDGAGAFDKNGNKVEVNMDAVKIKAEELRIEYEAKIQSEINARQTALNKLSALGLTESEIKALLGN